MLIEQMKTGISPGAKVTGAFLVLANLVPLIGVFAWGWSVYEVVILYWAENVILGVLNILRMLFAREGNFASKLFMIPFFTVHYGFFCSGHGFFINAVLNSSGDYDMNPVIGLPALLWHVYELTGWALIALVISHGFSFVWNYLLKGEYKTANIGVQMFAPYGRIALLHIAILIGGIFTEFLGSPVWMLVLLVIGKIAMDLGLHLVSHSMKKTSTEAE